MMVSIFFSSQQIEGMTRIIPKPGRGGRPVKSENFAINEPGREPFYVHAYSVGTPDQCADLQVSLLDVKYVRERELPSAPGE